MKTNLRIYLCPSVLSGLRIADIYSKNVTGRASEDKGSKRDQPSPPALSPSQHHPHHPYSTSNITIITTSFKFLFIFLQNPTPTPPTTATTIPLPYTSPPPLGPAISTAT